jgi:AbrB family looped-hinge helix DNA binding protein
MLQIDAHSICALDVRIKNPLNTLLKGPNIDVSVRGPTGTQIPVGVGYPAAHRPAGGFGINAQRTTMAFATITSKGQTTIPKEVRAAANLKSGDRIHFTVLEDGTIVVRVKNRSIGNISFKPPGRQACINRADDALAVVRCSASTQMWSSDWSFRTMRNKRPVRAS